MRVYLKFKIKEKIIVYGLKNVISENANNTVNTSGKTETPHVSGA